MTGSAITGSDDQPAEQPAARPDVQPDAELIIAIDGPAGAGKSTVGHAIAGRLGLSYLDTGAMYRAATFAVLRSGVDPSNAADVADVVSRIDLDMTDDAVLVDGVDATTEIRGREVTAAVSAVAAVSDVRAQMVRRQRAWVSEHGGGVIEGRDIGSVVFPDARLKLYVTASPRVRAERRVADIGGDIDDVESSIIERDRKDSSRADSPLIEASGSTVVDTSGLTVDEVVDRVMLLLWESQN